MKNIILSLFLLLVISTSGSSCKKKKTEDICVGFSIVGTWTATGVIDKGVHMSPDVTQFLIDFLGTNPEKTVLKFKSDTYSNNTNPNNPGLILEIYDNSNGSLVLKKIIGYKYNIINNTMTLSVIKSNAEGVFYKLGMNLQNLDKCSNTNKITLIFNGANNDSYFVYYTR